MKSAALQLLEMDPSMNDRWVALMLADKCLALAYKPFRFSINHDIRPPKNLACPLHYDWTRRGHVGVEMDAPLAMRQWLTKAFLLGYTVSQINAKRENVGYPHSIAIARRRAEVHQRKPENDDDDIPF